MSTQEHAVEHGHEGHDHGPGEHAAGGHAHPSDLQYVYIALFLAMVTAAEVAVYYVKALEGLLVYILVTMAVVKFSVVVMFFMHLRFDSKIFRRFFITTSLNFTTAMVTRMYTSSPSRALT